MNPLVALPFFLALSLYAAYLKVGARLVRRAVLPWSHAFGFAVLVGAMTMVGRGVALSHGAPTSPWLPLAFGVALHLGLGTWFFSGAARARDGEPLGWRRALAVVGVALALLLATTLVLGLIVSSILDNLHFS